MVPILVPSRIRVRGQRGAPLRLTRSTGVIGVDYLAMNRPHNVRALRALQPVAHSGWPTELGIASTSGTSADMRYAYFPQNRRLAVEYGGVLTIYDTAEYQFRGMLQAHPAETLGISILTQRGRVRLTDLVTVSKPA